MLILGLKGLRTYSVIVTGSFVCLWRSRNCYDHTIKQVYFFYLLKVRLFSGLARRDIWKSE